MTTARWRTGISGSIGLFLILAPLTGAQALVNTGDIANLAVTTPKIGPLAVTADKLGAYAVTNIKLYPGAVTADKLGTNAVTNIKLYPGAVTADKLGNYSVTNTKLYPGAVTADKLGDDAVTPGKISYNRNVIIVAPTGGDFTSPVAALASITDASESNPYLVKLMPGLYNIGGGSVIMKEYVDLEGSGEIVTCIVGTVSTPYNSISGDSRPLYGVVTMANESEIRHLQVKNTGAGTGTGKDTKCVTAILSRDTFGNLSHVSAVAQGTNCNVGILVDITVAGSDQVAVLQSVFANADGGVIAIGMAVRGSGSGAEMSAALLGTIATGGGASTDNVGLNVRSAAPIVQGGILLAEGGTLTLALKGEYGLPTLQGVLAMGAVSLTGNSGVAVLNQSTLGPVFLSDSAVDIFNSSVGGAVTVADSGGAGSTPSVARCAGTVRTDTLATLNGTCQ